MSSLYYNTAPSFCRAFVPPGSQHLNINKKKLFVMTSQQPGHPVPCVLAQDGRRRGSLVMSVNFVTLM